MPHEDKICLPSCQSKTDVYNMYKADIFSVSDHDRPVVWSSFKGMWKAYFSNVIIPKVNVNERVNTEQKKQKQYKLSFQ